MVCNPPVALYTVILGGYDSVTELPDKYCTPDIKRYLFTDDPNLKSETWAVVVVDPIDKNDIKRSSRHFKCRPDLLFPNCEFSIYIDGNAELLVDPIDLLSYLRWNDIALYRHWSPSKNDLYDEAIHCIQIGKDEAKIIGTQAREYRLAGHPKEFGLYNGGVVIRRHNKLRMVLLGQMWWEQIVKHSRRDQISLPYCLWNLGITPAILCKNMRVTDLIYSKKKGHLK